MSPKENIKFGNDFICQDCFTFFSVRGKTKLSEINCPNCKSNKALWSRKLIQAKNDGKSQSELIEILKKY